MKHARTFIAAAAAALLAGPALGAPKGDITLTLRDKVIRNLSSSGLILAFHIGVDNKGPAEVSLVRYRYRVTVNQREFLNMDVPLDPPLPVPAGRETLIGLPVKVTYELLNAAVGPVGDKALCDVVGDMFFRDAKGREDKVSFAYPGEFPIFKDPEVEFLPLQVNDLTVGGADLVFRVRFKNPNPYELVVDKLSYKLLFGGKQVQEGLIPGDKSLPAGGEKVFELAFLLDFFEAGQEIGEELRKPAFSCRLTGEIVINSAWGPLRIGYDKTQEMAVPNKVY